MTAEGAPLVVFGDSHTRGTGASRRGKGFAAVLARDLGLPLVKLGFGDTGFVHAAPRRLWRAGGVLGDRLHRIPASRALLVVQVSAHDRPHPDDEVRAAIGAALDRVGSGPVLLVGPLWARSERERLPALRAVAAAAAADHGFEHADADGWVRPEWIGPDGAHLGDRGHAEVAARIAAVVRERRLVTQPVT